jgi:hypothetical protein
MADPVAQARRGWPPPKARVAAPTAPRDSPPQGAKDKVNERIAAQLAGPERMTVAKVVHLPKSSPDVPSDDLSDDDDGSPTLPSCVAGRKTTGLELGDSSPNFSHNNSPVSLTNNKVSKYSLQDQQGKSCCGGGSYFGRGRCCCLQHGSDEKGE